MVNLVVISHGDFCNGLMETLKMVAGSDFGIKAVSLKPGETPEVFREKLSKVLSEVCEAGESETIVLADLAGGTPYPSALYLAKEFKISVISGMNMPMLLTLALDKNSEKSMEELVNNAITEDSLGVKVQLFKEGERRKRAKLSLNKN
jgi:PTS system mannose-specific IIA component